MMITSVLIVFMYKCLLIKCHRQNKPFPAHRHGPKGVFFGCKELSGKGAKEAKTQRNSWKSGIALRLCFLCVFARKNFPREMYLSGYVTTPACLLSSRRVETVTQPNRRNEKLNTFRKTRIVMTTAGSLGDLNPYIALALEMKKRNIEPVIASTDAYRERVESLNIEFHAIRPKMAKPDTPEYFEKVKGVVDPNRGAEYLFKRILVPALRDTYQDLSAAIKGADLLITHPIVLAGPPLAQKSGIPWISTVLSPASLWSAFDPFVPPNMPWIHGLLKLGGPPIARLYKKLMKAVTDPWLKDVYAFRAELGLPRGEHGLFEGQYAPELNLALFSKVMYEPQADWPANTVVTGFPFFDKKDNAPVDPELLRFLNSGPAPIVFTLGSAAIHVAGNFYQESAAAAKVLNRRAILLLGSDRNRPKEPLPEGVVAFDYAPFGELLPRAAAMIHQGGVGTTGQGLRAGIPMIVVPFAHDQPDNAARIGRLGVARTITRDSYKAERVATELKELLENPSYSRCAREVGSRVRSESGAALAVDLIMDQLNQQQADRFALRTVA
jgi:UDP:flavonoid glycosyltransferase YjiC (YdhE family)